MISQDAVLLKWEQIGILDELKTIKQKTYFAVRFEEMITFLKSLPHYEEGRENEMRPVDQLIETIIFPLMYRLMKRGVRFGTMTLYRDLRLWLINNHSDYQDIHSNPASEIVAEFVDVYSVEV